MTNVDRLVDSSVVRRLEDCYWYSDEDNNIRPLWQKLFLPEFEVLIKITQGFEYGW